MRIAGLIAGSDPVVGGHARGQTDAAPAGHRPARTEHARWTARFVIQAATLAMLLSVTLFERFGIAQAIDCSLPAIYLFVVAGLIFDSFELSPTRLTIYGAMVVAALLSYWLNRAVGSAMSVPSMLLYFVIYAPFTLSLRPAVVDGRGEQVQSQFLAVALICAVAGILQFYLQFIVHAPWLFDFTYLIPEALRGSTGFNTVYNVGLFTKSNGFFLREPSEQSLLMGLAIVVEWSSKKRRPWRLACFIMALLLSYSGTGIMALTVALMVPFNYKVALRLLGAILVAAFVFFVVGDVLQLDVITRRVHEFGSPKSSGYQRYIAPALLVRDGIADTSWTPLFGHGPGMITRASVRYLSHDPTWGKSIFEYGLVGFAIVCALFIWSLRKPLVSLRLRVVLFVTWLVAGGNLLAAPSIALRLSLAGFLPAMLCSAGSLDRRSQRSHPLGRGLAHGARLT
jgi:hypothetical protein